MTHILEFEAHEAVAHQAREWLIRLDAETPLDEMGQHALREWLDRSPVHREELDRIRRFWAQANVLSQLSIAPDPRPQRVRTTLTRWSGRVLVAGILLVVLVRCCIH